MDADRFDRLTRDLAARFPRRGALRRLGGLAVGALLAARAAEPAAAQTCGPNEKPCTVRRNGKTRTICLPLGQCCPNERSCNDGTCAGPGACCSGETPCPRGSAGPFVACVVGQCCPDEKQCPGGSCVKKVDCCDGERACTKKVNGKPRTFCIPDSDCCPNEKRCADGGCVKSPNCCPDERSCTTKANGTTRVTCISNQNCCPDQKQCSPGRCIAKNACCPVAERECERRVKGKIRTFCIPGDQCCPTTEVPCAIAPSGCCNALLGEECATSQRCCDVLGAEEHVCDGKWCCAKEQQCVPGQGCVTPCTGCPAGTTCCGRQCITPAQRCCDPAAFGGQGAVCFVEEPCCLTAGSGWVCCGGGATCVNNRCQ